MAECTEREDYGMSVNKSISPDEHKAIMLNIMKDFAEFCDKNGLAYFLDAGTLLGAVRHQGFIPWDNDMDICMIRPEYDRMIALLRKNGGMLNDHIVLEEPEDTIYCFCKLGDTRTKLTEFPDTWPEECYIYIDVFPKDGLQDLSLKTKAVCKTTEILGLFHWFNKHSIPYWSARKRGMKQWLAKLAGAVVKDRNRPYRIQQRFIRNYAKKHPLESCEYANTLVNGEFHRICRRACFDERVLLDFEGEKFYAPKGYDEWLRVLYGNDYMTPPPPEKQQVHNIIATWR